MPNGRLFLSPARRAGASTSSATASRSVYAATTVLFVIISLHLMDMTEASEGNEPHGVYDDTNSTEDVFEAEEPGVAVLFPWFTVVIGTMAYFATSRFAEFLPYTAVMFVIGTIIGLSNTRMEGAGNLLHESVSEYWRKIDGEVLLLCFLPGLIFKDAWSLDANLFQKAFFQMLNFAFPMVLGGTCLTALVAYYIFPYDDWSWNFCMTFGSILSATDPVAVAALLEAVGAPPRLKVHVSGEALMNDGSAIVFYTIFSQRYLLELGVPGLGEEIDWGRGIQMFVKMSLGGAAIGIAFGLATIFTMHLLNRRLDREENVVEVSTSLAAAYLCYFTADFALETSGVIATLSMGLVMNEYGRSTMNDLKLFKDVWSIVEHILNTILFTLGGLVWGSVISNADTKENERASFKGQDWGYLILLYLLLHVIRLFLFAVFYPLTNRLGLLTSIKEEGFQVFGGLRGAVGIALAIAIDNTVLGATEQSELEPKWAEQTSKLFGYVGGMAFLTLTINATFAGPLLVRLGLADMTSFRKNILGVVGSRNRAVAIDKMVALLAKPWFKNIDYTIIEYHVGILKEVYLHEVIASAKRYENVNHHHSWYLAPKLSIVVPHLKVDPFKSAVSTEEEKIMLAELLNPRDGRRIRQSTHHAHFNKAAIPRATRRARQHSYNPASRRDVLGIGFRMKQLSHLGGFFSGNVKEEIQEEADPNTVEESRRLFLEVLRAEYDRLVDNGNLARREDLNYVLMTSIDLCADTVNNGGKLNDWEFVRKFRGVGFSWKKFGNTPGIKRLTDMFSANEAKEKSVHIEVNLAIAFLEAHTRARRVFSEEFAESQSDLSVAESQVMKESEDECRSAELLLSSLPEEKVKVYVSHIFSNILLNKVVKHIEFLAEASFLKESEAEEFLEHIQEELFEVEHCTHCANEAAGRNTQRGDSMRWGASATKETGELTNELAAEIAAEEANEMKEIPKFNGGLVAVEEGNTIQEVPEFRAEQGNKIEEIPEFKGGKEVEEAKTTHKGPEMTIEFATETATEDANKIKENPEMAVEKETEESKIEDV